MTLPNKLTLIRILLIPVMIVIYYIESLNKIFFLNVTWSYFIMLIIFVLASFTDFLDGYIARKSNQITTFGKLADPLADKMLTFSAMAILMLDGFVPMWVFVVILVREFLVSGVRMLAVEKGVVIAAGYLGKVKTVLTMLAIFVLFLSGIHESVEIIGLVIMYIACAFTIISGVEYIWKSRKHIFESI